MREIIRLLATILCTLAAAHKATAQEAGRSLPRFETYITGDYAGRVGELSTTTVWSVFGPIAESGFRLKLDGLENVYGDTSANLFSGGYRPADLKAYGDLMVGYQFVRDPVWIKIYAGAAYQDQIRIIWQIREQLQQPAWGATAAMEAYWRASDRLWLAANLTWFEADNSTTLYSKTGYRVFGSEGGFAISLGAETSATFANADMYKEGKALDLFNDFLRAGALVNLRYGTHELTLSGGLSQASSDATFRPYVTLTYGKKF